MSFSSWASPLAESIRLRNDEGDPLGRPRFDGYAARELACMPPNEGLNVPALPGDERRSGARAIRHGRFGQVGKGWMGKPLHVTVPIGVCRLRLYPIHRSDVKALREIA